jgi:hypothetical protein
LLVGLVLGAASVIAPLSRPGSARALALGALALALGAVLRLWWADRTAPQTLVWLSPSSTQLPLEPAAVTLPTAIRLDTVGLVPLAALLALATLAIGGRAVAGDDREPFNRGQAAARVAPRQARPEPGRSAGVGILAVALVASGIVVCPDLTAVATLWTLLVLLGPMVSGGITGLDTQVGPRWLAPGILAAVTLAVAAFALAARQSGSAVLPAGAQPGEGLAAAGLAVAAVVLLLAVPGAPKVSGPRDRRPYVWLTDAAVPLIGYVLAVRAVALIADGPTGPLGPGGPVSAGLALAGTVGLGMGAWLAGRAADSDGLRTASRSVDGGLVLLAVAAGSPLALVAALYLAVAGALARSLATTALPIGRWLGAASLVGLPPLPGFAARGLVLAALLASGPWLVAGVAGVGTAVASHRLLGAFIARGRPAGDPTAGARRGVVGEPERLLTAGLVLAALVPTAALVRLLGPSLASSPIGFPLAATLGAWLLIGVPQGLAGLRPAPTAAPTPRFTAAWAIRQVEPLAVATRRLEDRYDLIVGLAVALAIAFAFVSR